MTNGISLKEFFDIRQQCFERHTFWKPQIFDRFGNASVGISRMFVGPTKFAVGVVFIVMHQT